MDFSRRSRGRRREGGGGTGRGRRGGRVGGGGGRMERTGDWGRWRKDGRIELAGRKDEQVKIRGYRVEMGEIEAVLGEHAGVKQAVVVMREHGGEEGRREKKLVAYVVAEAGEECSARQLREYLKERLPEYMVPAQYVVMEEFPLTESGKVERKKLPEAEEGAYGQREYEAPEGELERVLAGIWEELLGVKRVG